MALFRLGLPGETVPIVRGDGVTLRPADMRDYDEWAALRERSRAFLTPWEPIWPADDLTRAAFRRRVRAHAEEIERDEAYPLFIFDERETLVGGITIGQVSRGVAQTATLGYWMGQPFAPHIIASSRCGCTVSKPPACPTTTLRPVFSKASASSRRATHGPTCESTASGRTICFTRCWSTTPFCRRASRSGAHLRPEPQHLPTCRRALRRRPARRVVEL
jgi:hypothetical protein